jgi:iron complex outermembrane recepter protein
MTNFLGRNGITGAASLAGLVSCVLLSAAAMAEETSPKKSASGVATLEEVVVTANKRSQNVQDVPASVSVQSGELLLERRQEQLSDYAAYVPGLNVGNLGKAGLASVNLRGVSSVSDAASVGAYLDEVPLGSSSRYGSPANQILDLLPYDLDRLEVLRGPQGTLYGAGSMGGLIKYVLKNPSLSNSDGEVGADVGTIDGASSVSYSARAVANMVLSKDVLGLRVSLYDKFTPGFIDNVFTGGKGVNAQRQQGGRAALLWQPNADLSIKLGAVIYRNAADDGGTVSYTGFESTPTTDGSSIGAFSTPVGDLKQKHAFPQGFRENLGVYTATIDWKPGTFELISATGYSNQRTTTSVDNTTAIAGVGFLPVPPGSLLYGSSDTGVKKFTEEVRLLSQQGVPLEWLAGVFYTDEHVALVGSPLNLYLPDYTFLGPLLPGRTQDSTYKEYAIFGDATWHITEKFDVAAGLRYANNKQDVRGTGALATSTSESVTTWSVSSRYRFQPNAMVYARIATGYRPGGLNTVILPTQVPPRVNSDKLTSYELGIKSEFMDRRLLLNLTAFYIDWKDIQLNSTENGNTILTNGGKATPKGLEFTASLRPVEGLTLGANAAYTDSQLKSTAPGAFFLTGYQLPGVPKFSYSLTADYAWAAMTDWTAHVGGGFRWVDKVWLTGVEQAGKAAPAVEASSYSLVNLNASLTRGPLTLKLYGANLANKRAIQGGLALINILNQPQQGDFWIVQPRSFGVGFDYKF